MNWIVRHNDGSVTVVELTESEVALLAGKAVKVDRAIGTEYPDNPVVPLPL